MDTTVERVRQLISSTGMTQTAFAELVGIEKSKLSKSLKGTRKFSSLDLAMLAEAGGVTVDWLLGIDTETAMAARASVGSSAEKAVNKALQYATMRSDLVGLGYEQQWRLPDVDTLRGRWVDQGADLADQALKVVRAGGRSVSRNLASVIEDVFGVDVAVQDLGENFDGLAVSTSTVRLILVATSTNASRQRFTMAHELGHLLAHDDQEIHQDRDIHADENRYSESEVRANAFAAAFLMPEFELQEWLFEHGSEMDALCRLATDLIVSPSALAYRLWNLELIDAQAKDQLRQLSSREAARKVECSDLFARRMESAMVPKAPQSLLRDTFAAFEEGLITLRPYAQLLDADPRLLREELADNEVALMR
ncbi:hypothetical protein HMPREF1531_01351 [Propionibacterium sp. oral taxon 192 str. F0372]|uniref:helix-turn-helix domain-containing protein n=1 Tax=Propionibacterium sp. oral taxon 192 TaxID=671222 RepID=UPI0003535253|nr:XRE family transcriptional regulator [Propionibacterium sp. oral taxon 192]EPH03292.1 hypothetical protein HMPREF1531_01351 [Propionibacterium sp. oral taxon 192 str. F0372]